MSMICCYCGLTMSGCAWIRREGLCGWCGLEKGRSVGSRRCFVLLWVLGREISSCA